MKGNSLNTIREKINIIKSKIKYEKNNLILTGLTIITIGGLSFLLLINYGDDFTEPKYNSISQEISKIGNAIRYENEEYLCIEGDTFETKLNIYGNIKLSDISNNYSSDPSKVKIEEVKSNGEAFTDSLVMKVDCKKEGYITLNASTSKGAKTISSVKVSKKEKGTIKFAKDSYECNVGDTFETTLTTAAAGIVPSVSYYNVSDDKLAEINDEVSKQVECNNCIGVKIKCKEAGNLKLSAGSSKGATVVVPLTIYSSKGTIAYKETNYSCKPGETIETKISTANDSAGTSKVKSFSSSNKKIVTIEKSSDKPSDGNSVIVKINCLKVGKTKLTTESTTGVKNESNIVVSEEEVGTINFEKNSYTCNEGESFETTITALGNNINPTVKSYKSSNNNASIEKSTVQPNCNGCVKVKVNCKKVGTIELTAESSTGVTTKSNLVISKKVIATAQAGPGTAQTGSSIAQPSINLGTIEFDKTSYTCEVGKYLDVTVTPKNNSNTSTVKSYSIGNTNIATAQDSQAYTGNCINCKKIRINCKSAGNTSLDVESSTGAKASVSVTVTNKNVGSIEFGSIPSTCIVGDKFDVSINVTGNNVGVKSCTSSDTNIATVEQIPGQQKQVKVTCKSAGNFTLIAKTTTEVTTVSSIIKVTPDIGSIAYEKGEYICEKGKSIETTITAQAKNVIPEISYGSPDPKKVNISFINIINNNCKEENGCKNVKIDCKEIGNYVLTPKSSTGATSTSKVQVYGKGKIEFAESEYKCTACGTINTKVTATGENIESYVDNVYLNESSNSRISSKNSNNLNTKINCSNGNKANFTLDSENICDKDNNCSKKLTINCGNKTDGEIILHAVSSTNAETTSTLKLNAGSIKFEKENYECTIGGTITTKVTATGDHFTPIVTNVYSNKVKIEKIEDKQICSENNCQAIRIDCGDKVSNQIEMYATSSTGALTESILITNTGKIEFDSTDGYKCHLGDSIEVKVTATGYYLIPNISINLVSNRYYYFLSEKNYVTIREKNEVCDGYKCTTTLKISCDGLSFWEDEHDVYIKAKINGVDREEQVLLNVKNKWSR